MLRPTLLVLAGLALPVAGPVGSAHRRSRRDARRSRRRQPGRRRRERTGPVRGPGRPRRPPGAATRSRPTTPPTRPTPPTRAQIKVVYAHAADRPNRFAALGRCPPGQRRDRPALPVGAGRAARRRSGSTWARAAGRSTWTSRPSRCRGRTRATPATSARSPAPSQAAIGDGGPRNTIILADALSTTGYELRPRRDDHGRRRRAARRATRTTAAGSAACCSAATASRRPAPAPRWWPEGLPARDHAHARRRSVGRAALHPAARAAGRALRPLLAGRRRHVLRRGPGAAQQLRIDCGPIEGAIIAELRLRPRRLLQPRAAARQLPGHALERVRLGVPGALRRGRAGVWRRRNSTATPRPPAATVGPGDRGREPPRRRAAGQARELDQLRRTRYAYQWQRAVRAQLAQHLAGRPKRATSRPRATSAAACG